jgi:hypothetical protein
VSDELFPVESVSMDSPRLAWLKQARANGLIKTHHNPHMPEPWIAIVPHLSDRALDIGEIMAKACRYYEEDQRIGYGKTEWEAVELVCEQNGIVIA